MLLSERVQIITRQKLFDDRGWFLKIVNGKESNLPQRTGEVYSILANPGESRANHYHKVAQEWFTLIQGHAQLQLEDIRTKDRMSIRLDSDDPMTVFVPNGIAHSIVNLGSGPYILIAYSDQLYDPTDTIPYDFLPALVRQ